MLTSAIQGSSVNSKYSENPSPFWASAQGVGQSNTPTECGLVTDPLNSFTDGARTKAPAVALIVDVDNVMDETSQKYEMRWLIL